MTSDMRVFRNIVENADYDVREPGIKRNYSIGNKNNTEVTNKGRADTHVRQTSARYGDNDMHNDSTLLDEFDVNGNDVVDRDAGILDRLQEILQKAGVDDDEIRVGVDLTNAGLQKVAARLGIGANEVPMLINSLTTRLRDEDAQSERAFESRYDSFMDEDLNADMTDVDSTRFGYEKDSAGNVTVRDSQSGKEVYLQGSQATELLNKLSQDPASEQTILADLEPLMEEILTEKSSLEIRADKACAQRDDKEAELKKAEKNRNKKLAKRLSGELVKLKTKAKDACIQRNAKLTNEATDVKKNSR